MSTTNKDIEIPLLSHSEQKQKKDEQYTTEALDETLTIDPNLAKIKYQTEFSKLQYVTFLDIWSHIQSQNLKKSLNSHESLPEPYPNLNIPSEIGKITKNWNIFKDTGHKALSFFSQRFLASLVQTFKSDILWRTIFLLLNILGRFYIIYLISDIIHQITEKALGKNDISFDDLIHEIIIFGLLELFFRVFLANFMQENQVLGSKIRLSMQGFIYKKILGVSMTSLKALNMGKVINLLGNNLNDVELGFLMVVPMILSPITIIVTLISLYQYFGWFSIVSIASLIGVMFLQKKISQMTLAPRQHSNQVTDSRVKKTTELIWSIRLLKLYAWEQMFMDQIKKLREKEQEATMNLRKYILANESITEVSIYLAVYVMTVVFALFDGRLTPEKMFGSLMILQFIQFWAIGSFSLGQNFYVNFTTICQRANDILKLPTVLRSEDIQLTNPALSKQKSIEMDVLKPQNRYEKIIFKNYNAYWEDSIDASPVLQDINLNIEQSTKLAIIGRVGAGKTTFLNTFLREIPNTTGQLSYKGSLAYVEQEPTIFSGTIQSNILFGRTYDEELYLQVVRDCELLQDFALMNDADMQVVGEKGVDLSGGQKARIQLARALYSQSDIYLLDDPLAALDSKVARRIFENVIQGPFLRRKIVILATHNLGIAKECDKIVLLDEGKIIAEGAYSDLDVESIPLLKQFREQELEEEEEEDEEGGEGSEGSLKGEEELENGKEKEHKTKEQYHGRNQQQYKSSRMITDQKIEGASLTTPSGQTPGGDTIPQTNTATKKGSNDVSSDTYKKYLDSIGSKKELSVLGAVFIVHKYMIIYFTGFLGQWALKCHEFYEKNTQPGAEFSHKYYILFGFILLLSIGAIKYFKLLYFQKLVLKANTKIHTIMIEKLIRSTVAYFDKTPIGLIINRFTTDLGNCDKKNADFYIQVLEGFSYLGLFAIIICINNFLVILPTILVIYFLYRVRNYYAFPLIATRKLDLESRSPLYSEIFESVHGLNQIRVFRQTKRLLNHFMHLLYISSKACQFQLRTMRLFLLSLEACMYVLNLSLLIGYIYSAFSKYVDPAEFGLVMTLMLEVTNLTAYFIRSTLRLDLNMQSAQRMLDLEQLPQEAKLYQEEHDLMVDRLYQKRWPHKGEIQFNNVYLRYDKTQNYALNGLSFIVQGGEKVGLVGRTGAGKSSIAQVLFRMFEIEPFTQSSIKIDSVNIKEIGLNKLRQHLSIIPQNPIIFNTTIRKNLDPFEQYDSHELLSVLDLVNLRDFVVGLTEGLDTLITPNVTIFSAGQKQQICFARAILRRCKIVLMDEPTSNIDLETEMALQNKQMEIFENCTVITIAHRLLTVANYDKIIVMDQGEVVEYDEPFKLLVDDEDDPNITRVGHFASMVQNAGESTAKKIFDIAREAYFKRQIIQQSETTVTQSEINLE